MSSFANLLDHLTNHVNLLFDRGIGGIDDAAAVYTLVLGIRCVHPLLSRASSPFGALEQRHSVLVVSEVDLQMKWL